MSVAFLQHVDMEDVQGWGPGWDLHLISHSNSALFDRGLATWPAAYAHSLVTTRPFHLAQMYGTRCAVVPLFVKCLRLQEVFSCQSCCLLQRLPHLYEIMFFLPGSLMFLIVVLLLKFCRKYFFNADMF